MMPMPTSLPSRLSSGPEETPCIPTIFFGANAVMHIAIYHPIVPRQSELSYTALQEKSGFSGTETALLELLHYLSVTHSHTVYVVGGTRRTFVDHGIHFIAWRHRGLVPWNTLEWFSPLFYTDAMAAQLLCCCGENTQVFLWLQSFIHSDDVQRLASMSKNGLHAVCVSQFVQRLVECNPHLISSRIVENAISPALCHDTLPDKTLGKWVFCAVRERGFDVTYQVFKQVQSTRPARAVELHLATYYPCDQPQHIDIAYHNSLSKHSMKELLRDADFFVYPLVLPNAIVHHDTFACVVLEAVAAGVIVVTWDVACMRDVYGNCPSVILVAPPAHPLYSPRAMFGWNPHMQSPSAVNMLTERVVQLIDNPEDTLVRRRAGVEWARPRTWSVSGEIMHQALCMAVATKTC